MLKKLRNFRKSKPQSFSIFLSTLLLGFFLVLFTAQCSRNNFENPVNPDNNEEKNKDDENNDNGEENNTYNYAIVDTGQKSYYDDEGNAIEAPRKGRAFYGQDAQYSGLQPAYKNNGDGTVTDLNTGLMWQKTPDFDTLRDWDEASDYAQKLVLAGHDDWRLPTIKELYSLIAFYGSMKTTTPYLDTDYFDFQYPDPETGLRDMDAQYWSSTRYVGSVMQGNEAAFGVNFADGRIKGYAAAQDGSGPTMSRYVRCVRGNTKYGINDFKDNGDGTITDRATNLMWMKIDSGYTMNWEDALEYSENLDYAGYSNWRLPNPKELQSIVDYTRAPDAKDASKRSAAIDPIFDITEMESWFWTGTSHGDDLSAAVYVCFGRATAATIWNGDLMNVHGAGAQRSDPKKGDPDNWPDGRGPQNDEIRIYNYVRCVRDAK